MRALAVVAATAMHAFGHALVALVAGSLAVTLVRTWALRDARSTPFAPTRALSEQALMLAAVGFAVVLVKSAAGVYATFVQGRVAGEVGSALRLSLLDRLLTVHRLRRPRHADHGGAGEENRSVDAAAGPITRSVAALTERVHEVEAGLKQGLLGGARAIAQLVPLAVVLVFLSPRMALVAAAVLGTFGAALGHVRAGYRRASAREASERARLLEAADEAVRHADLWVSYGAEAKARSRVRTLGEALARGASRLEARAAALSGANEVLGAAALLLAVASARAGWMGAVASGDTLLAFAVAFFLAYRPLRELAEARLALARAEAAYAELAPVAGTPPHEERDEEAAAEGAGWSPAPLELRDLRLAHGTSAPVSMQVAPGRIVAILGPTGVGKTTLLRTLLGLEPAAGGDILFDGSSIEGAPAGPAARPFAWVPQDAPLLADTLGANVGLGAAGDGGGGLEPLGAARLESELQGARLGAGGRPVSGGERQWIALARAIATRQPVLLLDEPTSGLDPASQQRVLEAIARLRGRRTVLLVTHRPEPLAIADAVVRMEAAA